jgi:hypothetical protein
MPNIPVSVEFVGYALAALAFIAFIFFVTRSELSGRSLTAASLVSVLWAGTMAVAAAPDGLPVYAHLLGEFALGGAWLFYLSMLLSGAAGAGKSWLVRYGWLVLTTMLLLIGSAQAALQHHEALLGNVGRTLVFGSVLIALYGLVLTEQVYRNARTSQRAGLKFLCLGLGSVFAYNLFLYSDAVLEGQVSYAFWAARGYVVAAACVPLLLVFVQRTPATISGIFVSRHIVFYTATLFGAGVYLVIVGFVGYYVRQFG